MSSSQKLKKNIEYRSRIKNGIFYKRLRYVLISMIVLIFVLLLAVLNILGRIKVIA